MPQYVEIYVITVVRVTFVLVMAHVAQPEIVSVKKIILTAQTVDVLKHVP